MERVTLVKEHTCGHMIDVAPMDWTLGCVRWVTRWGPTSMDREPFKKVSEHNEIEERKERTRLRRQAGRTRADSNNLPCLSRYHHGFKKVESEW